MSQITPVILSGGAGTRLWPLSRKSFPKQFLTLVGTNTMIQATAARAATESGRYAAPVAICNASHGHLLESQLRETGMSASAIILEPVARGTAAALAIAALYAMRTAPGQVLLVMPSDHFVSRPEAFALAVERGQRLADAGYIVTFGIKPDRPETGFGYIRQGQAVAGREDSFIVASFEEKPNAVTAAHYLAAGDYLWNSGIFMMRADSLIAAFEAQAPTILAACRAALDTAKADGAFVSLDEAAFAASALASFDKTILEHIDNTAVVPVDIGWSDVGTWHSLAETADRDENGNVAIGRVVVSESTQSYLHTDGPLVAVHGLNDAVVIATKDAVLVTTSDRAHEIGMLVTQIKEEGFSEAVQGLIEYRPWGDFERIAASDKFKIKRMTLQAGTTFAPKQHDDRTENWIIVDGRAEVTIDGKRSVLQAPDSILVPCGVTHGLKNIGEGPLVLLEIQRSDGR